MHILIIPSERYVPIESPLEGIFQQHLVHALARASFKVGVISPQLRSIRHLGRFKWSAYKAIEHDQGIPVLVYHGWRWIPRLTRFERWLWVHAGQVLFDRYMTRYGRPDLVHAHNAQLAGCLAHVIKQIYGIPYVLTEHSSAYAQKRIALSEFVPIRAAFQNAEKRLVVSPSLGHDLETVLGEVVQPWQWVPNLLDSRFEQNQLQEKEKTRDSFRFLSVGSLTRNKGHAELLQAVALCFTDQARVQLRIGGDGPLRRELEALSNSLGIAHQVKFLGELDRATVLSEMQSCDAYVHSSHYETFSVVLIEAMACGKPVVATACGGPEYIVCKENGILVPPKDIVGLGAAMVALKERIAYYDPVWIRQDCIARFGEQAIVKQLSEVYSQALANMPS